MDVFDTEDNLYFRIYSNISNRYVHKKSITHNYMRFRKNNCLTKEKENLFLLVE
jgi:hypothetical protein